MSDKSDGLTAFDGFVRKAACDGMFNDDQLGHLEYLSSLPPERKCRCRWYVKWDCYHCNHDELKRRGGRVEHRWNGTVLFLPDGRQVDYGGLCQWLRSTPEPDPTTASV